MDLADVRRVYVTPPSWEGEGRTEVQPDIERWCYPCRTHYPHQSLEGGGKPLSSN